MDNNISKQEFFKEGDIVWKSVWGLVVIPLFALIAIPLYAYNYGFQTSDFVCLLVFYVLTGLSITMGYHRYWSHRSFKANKLVSRTLLVLGTAALQNSVIQWASDHRKHHKDVDHVEKDPYAATKGFWFSHITWMFKYPNKDMQELKGVNDLWKDKDVAFQHKHYTILALLACFGLPAIYGMFTGRIFACILLGGFLRVVLVHHATFCINSLAHTLGSRPYSLKNTARDSFITAIITGGEGYHNYHHAFAGDYRNGIRLFDLDPSKWMIALLAKIGWCTDLKRTPQHLIEVAKEKVKLDEMLKDTNKDKTFIEHKYQEFIASMKKMYLAKQEYLKAKKQKVLSRSDINSIKSKYKNLKVEFFNSKKEYKSAIS